MASYPRVIIDTDIIIKIFRGDKDKRELHEPIQESLALSVITAMELINGARSKAREFDMSKAIKAYFIFPLSANVGKLDFALLKKYHHSHSVSIADTLIAATAKENDLPL